MTNTTENLISGTAPITEVQTPENTVAPFEPIVEMPPLEKKKYVRPPRTKAYREAKAAERAALGIGKPGPKSKAELAAETGGTVEVKGTQEAIDLLKALVKKLVALENNEQYRSVWHHFFVHGGVYNGPRYLDELSAAIAYLQSIGK